MIILLFKIDFNFKFDSFNEISRSGGGLVGFGVFLFDLHFIDDFDVVDFDSLELSHEESLSMEDGFNTFREIELFDGFFFGILEALVHELTAHPKCDIDCLL